MTPVAGQKPGVSVQHATLGGSNVACAGSSDPKLVAAARELKARWQVNGGLYLPEANGKYEVSRGIGEAVEIQVGHPRQLAIEPTKQLAA